jgi:hypothetical protein
MRKIGSCLFLVFHRDWACCSRGGSFDGAVGGGTRFRLWGFGGLRETPGTESKPSAPRTFRNSRIRYIPEHDSRDLVRHSPSAR